MTEKDQIQFLTEQNNQLREMIRMKDEFFEREHQLNLEDKKKLSCLKDLAEQQEEFMKDLGALYFLLTRCKIELLNKECLDYKNDIPYKDTLFMPDFLKSRNCDTSNYRINNIDNLYYCPSDKKYLKGLDFSEILENINNKGLKYTLEQEAKKWENKFGIEPFGNRVVQYITYKEDMKKIQEERENDAKKNQ